MSKKAKSRMEEKEEAAVKGRTVSYWVTEIADSRKREKGFRKLAAEAVSIYEAEETATFPFNILYSNTETLQSALYNSIPKPLASRRFKDADPLGKIAGKFISRYLEFFIDSNDRDYSNFDEMITSAVLEGLVPGRGLTRFKYDAIIIDKENPKAASVTSESVCGEEVPWNRVYFGYARRWADVPFIAFEHFMSKEELERNFDLEAIGKEIPLTITESSSKTSDAKEDNPPKDLGEATLAHIYEIWDKDEKEVIFICPDLKDKELKKVPDPLKLSGFYPIPKPLTFGKKISSMVPVPLYAYYQEQAKELNRITVRINNIVKALKVRGFFDSSLEAIEKVLEAADNTLVPVGNVAAMQQGQTLEKSIWLMPIERLINVLQQLYVQRTQVKSIIYEITAISDIMHGASQASETLGAQEIKTQWGSLRLKSMQKEVARYVRDCLRIVTEIGFQHLSKETLMASTNMHFPTEEQKAQAQVQIQQLTTQHQMQMPPAMPGQPPQALPPPVRIPPMLTEIMETPSIESLMAVLTDEIALRYKIDIETDSTISMETAGDKKDMGESLNAISQFLNGAMPMVEAKILPFAAMKSILGAVARRFKFGTEVEDELAKMQEPPPKPPEEKAKGPDPALELKKLEMEHKAAAEAKMFEAQQAEKVSMLDHQKAQETHAAELASKERTEQMRVGADSEAKQAQRQLEKYKIDQDNATKLEVAKITARVALVTAPVQIEGETSNAPV